MKKILAVAPMMDWTDRHCRAFHRMLSKNALLYTEMVHAGAILFGDQARHLDFDMIEKPLVLQLGGSEPLDLAQAAQIGQRWGYSQIDINCGCPSERVQRGSFGACLMAEPKLVSSCVQAILEAVDLPVSVKHRLGLDAMNPAQSQNDYQYVLDFMLGICDAGATQLSVHARNAVLKGLSPKENRTIPPLRYEIAKQLRVDVQKHYPHVQVLLNGGLSSNSEIFAHWNDFDGFMIGRAAYHTPAILLAWDRMMETNGQDYGYFLNEQTWRRVQEQFVEYTQNWLLACQESGRPERFQLAGITRHILGFAHGLGGSRLWRQQLSDHRLLHRVKTVEQVTQFFEMASAHLRIFSDQSDSYLPYQQID